MADGPTVAEKQAALKERFKGAAESSLENQARMNAQVPPPPENAAPAKPAEERARTEDGKFAPKPAAEATPAKAPEGAPATEAPPKPKSDWQKAREKMAQMKEEASKASSANADIVALKAELSELKELLKGSLGRNTPQTPDPLMELPEKEREYWQGTGKKAIDAFTAPIQKELAAVRKEAEALRAEREAAHKAKQEQSQRLTQFHDEWSEWKVARGLTDEAADEVADTLLKDPSLMEGTRNLWAAFERGLGKVQPKDPEAAKREAEEKAAKDAAKRRATGIMGTGRAAPETEQLAWTQAVTEARAKGDTRSANALLRERFKGIAQAHLSPDGA